MPFSRKWRLAWCAPALLIAAGCNPTAEKPKYEVADDEPAQTETTATESNRDIAERERTDREPSRPERDEVASNDPRRNDRGGQEPAKGQDPLTPPVKEKSISDLELPKDGTAEDYDAFLAELLTMQPTSEAERDKILELARTATDKVLELEKDQDSDRWKQAFNLRMQVKMTDLIPQLVAIAETEGEKKEEAKQKLQASVDDVLSLFKDREPDPLMAQGVFMLVQLLSRLPDEAVEEVKVSMLETYAPKLAEAKDEDVKNLGGLLNGIVRQAKLIGNEMEITGKTVDGKDFDLKEWQGKVVLVDFWATWCPPCVAEYPNMLAAYKKYHEKGFEIVGISADHQLEDLTSYIKEKEVPWPNMYVDGGHPAAEYYGVMAYPTMILIGRDGKVLSKNARGEELNRLLEEQFGEAGDAAPGEEKPEEPPAEAKSEGDGQ